MSNIATTIEQSKHLLELGLDPKTADCKWVGRENAYQKWFSLDIGRPITAYELKHCPPAWTLGALLKLMPSFIDYKGQKLRLTIERAGVWNVFYLGTEHRLNEIWFNGEYGEPVEPAYKMVCWLLEQGLIKKEDNNE